MILTTTIRSEINSSAIASVCRILHNQNKTINKTNVIQELILTMKERGTLGIEYIYDRDGENRPYENLDEDVTRICKELDIEITD